jgi:hypothetical protein
MDEYGQTIRSADRMNKLELIQALKDATDLSKPEAVAVVEHEPVTRE